MRSIWYGRTEKLFGTEEERNLLLDYTKSAVDFAAAIGCKNLVFGCPKNRCIPEEADSESCNKIAIDFFKQLGDYAFSKGTCIGSEPFLKKIEERNFHNGLIYLLKSENYNRYISIEMGLQDSVHDIEDVLKYVKELI